MSLSNVVQGLTSLQEIDSELMTLEKAKGDAPQRLEELQSALAEVSTKLDDANTKLESLRSETRSTEASLDDAKDLKKKYEGQLSSVKTNKEWEAVTLEIENTEKKIDTAETAILQMMEQEEKIKEEMAELKESSQQLEGKVDDQKRVLEDVLAQTQSRVDELTAEREQLKADLPINLYRTYERIRGGKTDGQAIAFVSRSCCSGCNTRIPPQKVVEIREPSQTYFCESCGRILVSEETDEPVAA